MKHKNTYFSSYENDLELILREIISKLDILRC